MRKSRFAEAQIIAILAKQERGVTTADVCRKHRLSTATFYNSKQTTAGWRLPLRVTCHRIFGPSAVGEWLPLGELQPYRAGGWNGCCSSA